MTAVARATGMYLDALIVQQRLRQFLKTVGRTVAADGAQSIARLINSIKTLQARTYVFNGKDKVSYTDTRTGATSYYVIEWKAHEVVSFKAQG